MKILYCAAHHNGGNDDERAIAYALEQLGHTVVKVSQNADPRVIQAVEQDCDFILFHKLRNAETLSLLKIPKVGWYFDLVTWPDRTLGKRNSERKQWMATVGAKADLMFCTDGDWVKRMQQSSFPEKFIRLSQGADERFVGRLPVDPKRLSNKILFTGIEARGGTRRASFVELLRHRYGDDFCHVTSGVHQDELKQLIANSKIVVAPDSPVTDVYWSNRVYLSLGFGAFLFHPRCEKLTEDYEHGTEILFYEMREELLELLDHYLYSEDDEGLEQVRENAVLKTQACHLYRHRLETLIDTVKERFFK